MGRIEHTESGSLRLFLLGLFPLLVLITPYLFSVYADSDLWWHLKTGLDILSAGKLPAHDSYSFMTSGRTWINHEWLAQIILAKAYLAGGAKGLLFLRASILVLTILVIYLLFLLIWNQPLFAAAVTGGFIAPILHFYLNLRPAGYSFLLLASIALVDQLARRFSKLWIWVYPAMILFFVNVHGSFLFGFILISLALVIFGYTRREARTAAIICWFITAATLLATPYGVELFGFVVREIFTAHRYIQEWQDLSGEQWFPVLLVFVACLVTAVLASKELDPTLFAFFLLSSALTFRHNRFFIYMIIFGSLFFVSNVRAIAARDSAAGSLLKHLTSPVLLFALAILCLPRAYLALSRARSAPAPIMIDAHRFPVHAVQFLASRTAGSRLALPFDWGGYAIWYLSPDYQVSLDGRYASAYDSHYADKEIEDYLAGDAESWLDQVPAETLLVEQGGKMARALRKIPNWQELYCDETASIFILRTSDTPTLNYCFDPPKRIERWIAFRDR